VGTKIPGLDCANFRRWQLEMVQEYLLRIVLSQIAHFQSKLRYLLEVVNQVKDQTKK
jgi:hypothetical protein